MNYSELISKRKEYKYSANLCFDLKDENRLAGFIPNITTTEILSEYLYGIIDRTNVHSRILYGSYGTGKSHLLTVLCALLGQINTDSEAFEIFINSISNYDKDLAQYLRYYIANQKPFLVVPIYSDHKDFDKCISFSLKKELNNRNIEVCFKSYFQEALKLLGIWENGEESSTRLNDILEKQGLILEDLRAGLERFDNSREKEFDEVFRLMTYGATFVSETVNLIDNLDTANEAIAKDYQGIVFVFDEFGRYLEDGGESVRVKSIQDFAEYCDHSNYNTYMILVSHKQLSLYTDRMRRELSDEWKKVEGRFRATSINSKYDQCLSLIPHIIPKTDKWKKYSKKYAQELKDLFDRAYEFKGFLRPQDERDPFVGGFPIHPITLYALDRLSKKVAQNERTFFTYLASDEDNALFKQLEKMDVDSFHFVGLDLIYDYFEANIRSYRTDDVYDNYKKLQFALNKLGLNEELKTERKVLKTIAVINIIADKTILAADRETLEYVIDDDMGAVKAAIDKLEQFKIIKFMRQYGFYDFLDSSIYDFDSMIEEKVQGITSEMIITELNESFVNFVIYPYEYNSKYHINRIFVPLFVQKQELSRRAILKGIPKYYDGILAMVFDEDYLNEEYLELHNIPDRSILLVNYSPNELMEEVKRYIAIKYFYSIRDELKKEDPTAVKELELYLEEQKGIVSEIVRKWRQLELPCLVTYVSGMRKVIISDKELSTEASEIMFRSFNKTIIVNNDIVNKNNISGTIRSSRNKVLSAIVDENGDAFEFSPMSPEHTMIRSVLIKNGFFDNVDERILNKYPTEAGEISGECAGKYVEAEIVKYFRKCIRAQRSLSELVNILKDEPFGLRDGYIPLLVANVLTKYQNVGIYFHGAEKEYSAEEVLKACENPEDYYIYLCDWTEEQTTYIDSLEGIFADYLTKRPKNRLKELLDAMNAHYAATPKIARATDKYVSNATKQYRKIMSVTHKDFHKFFFEELPEIESNLHTLIQVIKRVYKELNSVLASQNQNVEYIIRTVLDISEEETVSVGLARIYKVEWVDKKYQRLNYQTNAFLNYVQAINPMGEDSVVIDNLAKIIVGFETDYWSDSTIDDFEKTLIEVVKQLNECEISDSLGENELQIIIKTSGDESLVSTFGKCEISQNGKMMLNKMKTTLDSFGQGISHEEKMVILAQLLSEI